MGCVSTVTCMVSFGDSKHEPVKPLQRLLDVTPLKLALSAKCTIHDVTAWCSFIYVFFLFNLLLLFCLTCVGTDTLIDKFWLCGWLFERLGNVCGCEALAISFSCILFQTQQQLKICYHLLCLLCPSFSLSLPVPLNVLGISIHLLVIPSH